MTVDELYEMGYMPSNMYYQLNGKSINENYRDFKNKQSRKFFEKIVMKEQLNDVIVSALDEILEGFPDFK